jgi:hypothetical protein
MVALAVVFIFKGVVQREKQVGREENELEG